MRTKTRGGRDQDRWRKRHTYHFTADNVGPLWQWPPYPVGTPGYFEIVSISEKASVTIDRESH